MAVNLSPVGGVAAQFFSNNGVPLAGGKIFTYSAGTTTPAATYTTSLGNVAWTNPIVLDAAGRVPGSGEIWLFDGTIYKFILKDSNDVLIATYDNITGINSNFVNFTASQEIQTATAGQTVFNLTTMQYQPGTNSLTVYVDGVNQYGPGAQYAYLETDSDTVTFLSGLHVGASVKFTTATQTTGNATDASVVAYNPPFTGAVATNVEDKLAQTVSVMDFGAVGDGVADDTAAIQAALDTITGQIYFPDGTYRITSALQPKTQQRLSGSQSGRSVILADAVGIIALSYPSGSWNGIYIEHLSFDGNNKANTAISVIGSSQGAVSKLTFDTLNIGQFVGTTIYASNITYCVANNINSSGGVYALQLENSYSSSIENSTFSNASIACIQLNYCSQLRFNSVHAFTSNGYPATAIVLINGSYACSFTDCEFEPQSGGSVTAEVIINGAGGTAATDNDFTNCRFIGISSTKTRSVIIGNVSPAYKTRFNWCGFIKPTLNSVLLTAQAYSEFVRNYDLVTYGTETYAPVTITNNSGNPVYVENQPGEFTSISSSGNAALATALISTNIVATIDNTIPCGTRTTRWTEVNVRNGVVITTPDGTKKYMLSVNDSGSVTTTLL